MSDFEKYRNWQRKHWQRILKECERSLEKALFPERPSQEFYDSSLFKEGGLCGTRWGDDYYMNLQIMLNSYNYNLVYCTEQLQKLNELTEEQWQSETKHLFKDWHKSEWDSQKWSVRDKCHAFRT